MIPPHVSSDFGVRSCKCCTGKSNSMGGGEGQGETLVRPCGPARRSDVFLPAGMVSRAVRPSGWNSSRWRLRGTRIIRLPTWTTGPRSASYAGSVGESEGAAGRLRMASPAGRSIQTATETWQDALSSGCQKGSRSVVMMKHYAEDQAAEFHNVIRIRLVNPHTGVVVY